MKNIISIDGRVCSGKTSIIELLKGKFKKDYDLEFVSFSCGEYYRNVLRGKVDIDRVDAAVIDYISSLCRMHDNVIIDGRTVGASLKYDDHPTVDKDVTTVLIDVDLKEQANRAKQRNKPEPFASIRDRDESDKNRGLRMYGIDIFKKKNYDIYVNTTGLSPVVAADKIITGIMTRKIIKNMALLTRLDTLEYI